MNKYLIIAVSACLLPALAPAQSALDGTWKADLNNIQMPTKPDQYLLQGGDWTCKTCVPPVSVKADGQDHPVTGHPYYDTASVKVVDAHTIEETDKKAGKTVSISKMTVSSDGKALMGEVTDSSASSGSPVTAKYQDKRVANGPAGAHAVSGSWLTTKFENVSDNGLLVTYAVTGSTLKMTNPLGQSYTAPLDGTDSPFSGDPGTTSVSVKRLDARTFEETDKRDGKVIGVARMVVAADGKTMKVSWQDKLHGTSGAYSNVKQ